MRCSVMNGSSIWLACGFVGAATGLLFAAGAAPTTAGPVMELPAQVRTEIEKYLGKGVVGQAIPAPTIDDPAGFLGLGERRVLQIKVLYGKMAGQTRDVRISRLERPDPRPAWRLDAGDESSFGEIDESGNFVQCSSQDRNHGVIARYEPPQPILLKGMQPGDSRKMRIAVNIVDLARPDKTKHKGHLDLVYSYIGSYEVTVPAGTYETVLFGWRFDGKIGPAKIKDDQYWFFAEGVGPVARINTKNISAMLLYRDTTKIAGVLESWR